MANILQGNSDDTQSNTNKQIYTFQNMSKSIFFSLNRQYSLYSLDAKCCICGTLNCSQSTDHSKVTISDMNELFKEKLIGHPQIVQIKKQVSKIYQNIKRSIFNHLEKDQYQLQSLINNFNFDSKLSKRIDSNLVSELLERNIRQLPSRKISKLVKILQKLPQARDNTQKLSELKQKTQRLLQNFNISPILQTIDANLPLKQFLQQTHDLKLKPKTSISEASNPQETDQAEQNKIYQWRNVRVTKNSKTVSLSNKNISDRQVMQQVPILANYKNLRQLQIRNNKISSLSCNLIANNMPFLTSIDIRGNNIDDKGIIKLINSIRGMKSFYISQTMATDMTGIEIVQKLNDLEMFWSQHTRITNEIALRIAQKPKIKVLSLIGNPIQDVFKQKMKKLFISKGYINV